ncbi:MAG TPA: vWA domain-containing protein [Thermoguttaceae bacterium]|nr:vWA domain-containing protein [Thermoguttaceae bacterium]
MRCCTPFEAVGTVFTSFLITGCILVGHGFAAEERPAEEKPRIEVVFCLDTTGSMSGLIAGAKEKIWSIASTMAMAKPAPDIQIGLVGYRDRGDDYVTKITPLTHDLDKVYADLLEYQADGGGDTPESVNQALHEAVHKIEWSKDRKVYRAIFLVGDCPPHMDYQDDVKYPEICNQANEKRISINTVQCGNHAATIPIWQEIARKAEGQYFQVEQSGSSLAITTPFDGDIVRVNAKLDASRIYYGAADVKKEQLLRKDVAEALGKKASEAASARRAVFNLSESGALNFYGANELLNDLEKGNVKLADIPADQLPAQMQNMDAAQREAFVTEKIAQRKELREQLKVLAQQRKDYIDKHLAKMAAEGAPDESFSKKFSDAFRDKAAGAGMSAPSVPAH